MRQGLRQDRSLASKADEAMRKKKDGKIVERRSWSMCMQQSCKLRLGYHNGERGRVDEWE